MTSDQPGFTAIPNWLIDDVLPHISSNAAKVMIAVARKTIGWNKDADRLSFSQLISLTGLNRTPLTAAIQELTERGVIEREPVKNSFTYRIGEQSRIKTDLEQSRIKTDSDQNGLESRPKSVQNLDTQKKKESIHEDVCTDDRISVDVVPANAATTSAYAHASEDVVTDEIAQPTLAGMPEHPSPPVAPAPPSRAKPKRERKPPAPPEVQRLYAPAYDVTQTAPRSEAGIAVRTACRNLWNDYEAMPDEVEGFGPWFAKHSPAARIAAEQRRPVSAPTPRQLYALWPQYRAYLDGLARAEAARERARAAMDYEPERPQPQRPRVQYTREELQAIYEQARRSA